MIPTANSVLERLENHEIDTELEEARESAEAAWDAIERASGPETLEHNLALERKIEEALGLAQYDDNRTILACNVLAAFKQVGLTLMELPK